MDFQVPAGLAASPVLQDVPGRRWLEQLPWRVAQALETWDLVVDPVDRLRHGAHAVVLPVLWSGRPAVLRVSRAEPSALTALRAWDGNGAVRVIVADPSGEACLLERLDPDRSLESVEPVRAAGVAGAVVARLAVAEPPGATFPSTRDEAAGIVETVAHRAVGVVPEPWVRLAVRCATDLAAGPGAGGLVHADLTRENLVARPGSEEFVAIDPRPMVGDPERSAPEFLLRSVDDAVGRLDLVLREFAAHLDRDRARAWVIARTVDYWSWAVQAGLTEDPVRCRRILEELADTV